MVQNWKSQTKKCCSRLFFFCYFQDILLKGLEMTYDKLHRHRTDNILDLHSFI